MIETQSIIPRFLGAFLLGMTVTVIGLDIAVWWLSPLAIVVFDKPYGYSFDYTTWQSWLRGFLVRLGSLAILYSMVGSICGLFRLPVPRLVYPGFSMPLGTVVGIFVYGQTASILHARDYYGTSVYFFLVVASPFISMLFIAWGFRIFRQ